MSTYDDTSDSLIAHPQGPVTVADQLAFDAFTDEQKRVARVVLHEELTEQIYYELERDDPADTKANLTEAEMENATLRTALEEVRDLVDDLNERSRRGWVKLAETVNAKVKEALE